MNVRFIRRVRGVLRSFLNLLKSLFEMLKGQLLLLFLSVLMYVIISFSEVTSNLNDCSIGFVRKSSCFLCRYNTFFNLFWDITEKVIKYICYLLFFCYELKYNACSIYLFVYFHFYSIKIKIWFLQVTYLWTIYI